MNKSNNIRNFLILGTLLIGSLASAFGQANVNLAPTGATSGTPFSIAPAGTCFYNFYDSGGPTNDYNNGADAEVSFLPSNAATHRIQMQFLAFDIESFDAFYLYNSAAVGTNQIMGPDGAVPISGFPAGNWRFSSPGTITANTGIAAVGGNASEGLSVRFRSDGSIPRAGWQAIVRQIPIAACAMTAPGNLSASTGPGNTTCYASVLTPLPTFSPGGCSAGYLLQYRINGGLPTPVTSSGFTTVQAPKGTNVVTWELIDPCGNGVITSANQTITVTDNTFPVVDCPANATISLSPGNCTAEYNYTISATDNCNFNSISTVSHPIDFNNGNAGVMFDVRNTSAHPITLRSFGPSLDAGTWPIQVYYTHTAATWQGNQNNAAAWLLAGSQSVTSTGPANATPITGFNIQLAPSQSIGIYITSSTGQPINYTGTGAGIQRSYDDGTLLVASAPGAGVTSLFGNISANRAYNGYVGYSSTLTNTPTLVSGIASGGQFPLGTTINTYSVTDAAGNSSTCSFRVTVNPYPNPVLGLVCNDLVHVSLDDNCATTLTADQILEGGPYKCYDIYQIHLDKIAPFGNGPWVPATLTSADIGKTYRVRVTDPETGNVCYGDIKVFDLLPPDLQCSSLPTLVPCAFSTDPSYTQSTSITVPFKVPGLPQSLVDNQTREYVIPVTLPPGATVDDIDLRVRISGESFYGNVRIEVESPMGTIVNAWNAVTGCGPSAIDVQLDDEGLVPLLCANYTTGKHAIIPSGSGSFSSFNGQGANGNWKVRISDINAGLDISSIERVDLLVKATAVYGVGFPNGVTAPPAVNIGTNTWRVPAGLIDNCSDVTLSYVDANQPQDCSSDFTNIITRRWTARDASGNTSSCTQTIQLIRSSLNDLVLPPAFDGIDGPEFECEAEAYPTPQWITSQGYQGWPLVAGSTNGCSISWDYEDTPVWTCMGSANILRYWSIVDYCTSEIIHYKQVIRVRDRVGPVFVNCPADVVSTTDPFACCATVNLPDVILQDQCAQVHGLTATIETVDPYTGLVTNTILLPGTITNFPGNNTSLPDTLGVMGSSGCLPVGDHRVTYTAEDACGNTSTCMFTLSVKDYSPPTAVCTEFTVVALGLDDPNDCYEPNQSTCQFAGVGYMAAANLDAGSYDNCNAIKFTVRRKAPYSDCINALNACEKDIATAESDTLKFYCCEVGTTQKVILRVYQLDPDGNLSTLPDGSYIYNECEVEVEVQDKLKPLCEPPLNVTVTCNLFDPSLWSYGLPVVVDNCCLDTSYHFMGVKGLQHTVNYSNFDSVCNKGTITRTFRAYDCRGAFSQCTQRVVVTYNQNYAVKFPDDKFITQCDSLGTAFGEPQFLGEDCELLGVSYEDVIFTVVPDACYKIERTWQIINWCTYLPDAPCINVPNPTPNSNLNSPANMVGPTVSALGTPAPWAPTVVKITPTDAQATNYSTFWNANANCYRYKQIIKVQDQQDPVAVCPTSPVEVCDLSNNDPTLWNDLQFWNTAHNSHDLCEGTANISISATDFCSGPHLTFRYILFLDLDGNGTMETVVNSVVPPAPGQVNYNNLGTVNFTGGTPITFDERGVPSNQLYRWALQTTVNGTSITGQITWNTAAAPNTHTPVQLPHGRHKVKWLVMDGCGNETTCEYDIIVKDCKAPTVTCINGLSVNMMPTNMITLYAADFLLNAEDNCTPLEFLKFGIRKSGTGTGFPYGPDGNPQISVSFDCSEIGTQPVEIWAIDSQGNADYCETYVIVQDNGGNCNTTNATVAGMLRTEADQGLEEAMMQISGQNPAGPTFSNFSITDQSGHYGFLNAVPMFANYTVTPNYDENPLNGVSTYDLVLISKHILGIETLNSPYKMLAADANKSGSITTFDIVELRKLLLGIYQELPANTSWRFVDKDFVFPNAQNPFQSAISENKTVAEISDDQMNDNFVAIKVGDVNESAQANSLMTSETRSNSTMLFDLEEQQVEAGEEFTVTLTAAEKVLGCQFTLNYGAELQALEVIPVKEMDDNNFAILSGEHAVTASWNATKGVAQPAFSLRFKALKSGQLSKMLSLSSRITATEYYAQQPAAGQSVERGNIALRFTSPQGSIITGQGFELYQNQPNPFVNRTQIGFYLPKACTATLSVRDGNGQLVHSQKGDFAAGYNTFIVEKSALQNTASGLYYYTLETPDDAATRKMIQVK